ncbi:MAG: AbrB/MazE/SpoVT family DNA-binding domain-containing protein [Desulfurococcales archaeon]|nr:AbrB/MazE/SpoVT family DNA-binding domain-containing protein [Desulfurococcales archaeon]
MTLKLKVGRKGYIILPKSVREAVGVEEGDELVVEIRDGILLKPVRKVDVEGVREALRKHLQVLRNLEGRKEPKLGDLRTVSLEGEFIE